MTTVDDPDDERDDPRALARRIRGDLGENDELDRIDPDTDDPRELARLIRGVRGRGR
jgi:hypothetical protein